jgi:hypothetical protein
MGGELRCERVALFRLEKVCQEPLSTFHHKQESLLHSRLPMPAERLLIPAQAGSLAYP